LEISVDQRQGASVGVLVVRVCPVVVCSIEVAEYSTTEDRRAVEAVPLHADGTIAPRTRAS
jgi:hypothetical protein